MDNDPELTTAEVFHAGYNLGYKMALQDLEALQAAELEGEYQAMLAENRHNYGPLASAILAADPDIKITVADLELNTTGGRWK